MGLEHIVNNRLSAECQSHSVKNNSSITASEGYSLRKMEFDFNWLSLSGSLGNKTM